MARTNHRTSRPKQPMAVVWGAAVAVVAVVVALILVKVTSGTTAAPTTSASSDIAHSVTDIPQSTLDAVGTSALDRSVIPRKLDGPLLTSAGKPEILYIGAEYCPFCAAERWAIVAALSRFGTFSHLGTTASSPVDVYPNTPTFTFYGSTYTSPYLVFTPVEQTTNQVDPSSPLGYKPLQALTSDQQALYVKYEAPPYTPADQQGIPFVNWANRFVSTGASYDPQVLQGRSMASIAAALSDPKTPEARDIGAATNLIIATTCKITGSEPSDVCGTATVLRVMSELPS